LALASLIGLREKFGQSQTLIVGKVLPALLNEQTQKLRKAISSEWKLEPKPALLIKDAQLDAILDFHYPVLELRKGENDHEEDPDIR
jgi:hypothetical protein